MAKETGNRVEYHKAYYLANVEKIREQHRAYRLTHKGAYRKKRNRTEYLKAYNLAHREKRRANYLINKEKVKKQRKLYYLAHTVQSKAYATAYRFSHKEQNKAYCLANPEKARVYTRKRRALKRGVSHEPYTDAYVYERDGWTCGICGRKINKRLKWPNPLSKSIDHIIAITKGGSDAPVNLQAAHLRCNASKYTGIGGQLRLIG